MKNYNLQERVMCTKRSASPRMTTTSVSDPSGPLREEGVMKPWSNKLTSRFGPPVIPFLHGLVYRIEAKCREGPGSF